MAEVIPIEESTVVESEPPVTGGLALDNEEFQKRVEIIMEAIKDPEKERRLLAEVHTYLAMFEEGFREMQNEMMLNGGPFAIMKKLFGMGKG